MLEHVPSRQARRVKPAPAPSTTSTGLRLAPMPEAIAPLLPAQRRIWLSQRLFPVGAAHAVPIVLRFEGKFDEAAMQRALDALAARHPALRTTFAEQDGSPVQCVWPATGVRLERPRLRRKLTGRDDEGALAALRIVLDELAHAPFDLDRGPLLRAHLIKRAPRSHVLSLIVHAAVCDDDSRRMLSRELLHLYRAFAAGRPDPLPPLPVTPHAIAATRVTAPSEESLATDLAWWTMTLAGVETLALPADRAMPPIPSQSAGRHPIEVPADIVAPLLALGAAEDATPQMLVLALFAALLGRVAGSDDVALGTPHSSRADAAAGVVGQLSDTLILRVDLAGDPTPRDLIRRARQTVRDALAHAATPFEQIVEALNPDRSLRQTLLTPITLAIHERDADASLGRRAAATAIDYDAGASLDDLRLDLALDGALLRGWLRYSRDRFDLATIARLASQFETLLRGAVANPDQPLAAISLLTEADRRRILGEWNPPAAATELAAADVYATFQRQATATPGAPALFFGDATMSYAALAARASAIADALRRHGIGPGATIGVCLDRGPDLPAAMLGVLAAGAACLPLDPSYPAERLAFMLADARASLILTDAGGAEALPATEAPRLRLDQPLEPAASTSPPATSSADSDAAYLVYTSGSTGTPKGVVVTHRGAVNLCRWLGQAYPFASDDVCAFLASASFVDTVWDLFGPLLNGAATVVVPDAVRKDPEQLIDLIADHDVTRLLAPPSLLRAMLDTDADFRAQTPRLRLIFSTAETLTPDLVERIADRIPHARLVNTYGSSETTAVVTTAEIAPTAAALPRIPIGRPIAGSRVYVLSADGELAPVGMPGEIAVGGAATAAGYLGRPDLTAEKFTPDPFAADSKSRLFRTGDRGRWLADGSLELLGRADRLVKIRGFRVELGEVEAALTRHPAVREAAVVADDAGHSGARLIAYVVSRAMPAPSADELRTFLRGVLPEFMLPARFVALDAMPRTPTGKLDRRALPVDAARADRAAHFVAPRTPTEAALASIWEHLLDARPIGVEDNFFDLGGQSLLVVRTMAAARDALGVNLPARALFETPTIAALAARIDAHRTGPTTDEPLEGAITPLNAGSTGGGIFLAPGGAGEAFNLVPFAKLFRQAAPERPAWGFIGRERFDGGEAQDWVREIAAHYIRELRSRQPDGPYLIVGACAGGQIAFEMAQQLHAAGAEVERLILMDVWHTGSRGIRRPKPPKTDGQRPHAQRLQERLAIRGLDDDGDADDAINTLRAASRETLERRFWLNQYVAAPYPLPITLLVNEAWHAENATLGWHAVAAGGLEVIVMAGGHDEYLDSHFADTVVQMRALLASIATGTNSFVTEEA